MNKLKFFDGTNSLDPFLDEVIADPDSTRILVSFSAAPVKGVDIFEVLQKAESVKDFNASTDNKVHYGIELEGRYTEHVGVVSEPLETAVLTTVAVGTTDKQKRRRRVIIYGLPSAPGNFDSLEEFNEWIERCPFAIDVWLVAKE